MKKKRHFNDLLVPVILTVCILPFVTRMAVYDYGYSKYDWHSDNSILEDFYTYYKINIFYVILFFAAAILVLRLLLYRQKTKSWKIFIPLFSYGLFAIISTICSVNIWNSITGHFVDGEGIGVILGYIVIAFYSYQIMVEENDYKTLINAITVMFLCESEGGWCQVFKHDLLNYEWMQKIVMNSEQFKNYGGTVSDIFTGNNVYLTLGNPNYAAEFLVMFDCVFAVMAIYSNSKKETVKYIILLADSLILTWYTYTRTAIVSLIVTAIMVIIFGTMKTVRTKNISGVLSKGKMYAFVGGVICGTVIVLVTVDYISGSRYSGRIIDSKKDNRLELIETESDGVKILFEGKVYRFNIQDVLQNEGGDNKYSLPFDAEGYVEVQNDGAQDVLVICFEGNILEFVYDNQQDKYLYRSSWGKDVDMKDVPKIDFGGYEYLGSGRLYIWSRIIPKLGTYIIKGSGPETFAEIFPQDDYTGKIIYAGKPARIIERAHNDYIMKWVQNGFIAMISMVGFYIIFIRKCINGYLNMSFGSVRDMLGYGSFVACISYMVCGLFIDSTIYVTPVFFVFVGVALSAVNQK